MVIYKVLRRMAVKISWFVVIWKSLTEKGDIKKPSAGFPKHVSSLLFKKIALFLFTTNFLGEKGCFLQMDIYEQKMFWSISIAVKLYLSNFPLLTFFKMLWLLNGHYNSKKLNWNQRMWKYPFTLSLSWATNIMSLMDTNISLAITTITFEKFSHWPDRERAINHPYILVVWIQSRKTQANSLVMYNFLTVSLLLKMNT